ncbi:uncharacterized protein LOC131936770 [Physella acuta]|uniref:uncharacterized protein LOC131936770 n=1 Tax=Physella acuta TaxID=109671 RepID=UPI0027DDF927|nr:uncharacterized protein LOC131936770 [Physella acuta]
MKWLIAVTILGAVCAAPQFNNAPSPAMSAILADMIKNMMTQSAATRPKLDVKPPPLFPLPTLGTFKPTPPFFPPRPLPPMLPNPMGPTPPAGMGGPQGPFMDLPNTGAGAHQPYMPMRSFQFCPPGPTTSDHCKDQKLQEALYHPDGTPRYNWVPPRNPWDTSLPDTVKDTALNVLMMKINSRPGRQPTPKEAELISYLGDPKDYHMMGGPQFGMAG